MTRVCREQSGFNETDLNDGSHRFIRRVHSDHECIKFIWRVGSDDESNRFM